MMAANVGGVLSSRSESAGGRMGDFSQVYSGLQVGFITVSWPGKHCCGYIPLNLEPQTPIHTKPSPPPSLLNPKP